MINRAQILKGLLEGCILEVISKGETYGYKITEELNEIGFTDLNEGSVYPVLIRLQKKELVNTITKLSPLGPKRKYFTISDDGLTYLKDFKKEWSDISFVVNKIIKGGN